MKITQQDYQYLIDKALKEDLGDQGDITSQAIFQNETGTATIIAKQPGVLAGTQIAQHVFHNVDSGCQFQEFKQDSDFFSERDVILQISGSVQSLLTAERTAVNFLGKLSGVATLTNKFVAAVKNQCKILDTRKTTPGWRLLEKYAVTAGGGENHRIGLFDMVLIKDNHIAVAGGIRPAVNKVRNYLDQENLTSKIEVEVSNLDQLKEAILLDVDRIMLDNMSIDLMKKSVEICGFRIPLEASGNINLQNAANIASTGIDYISIGALTHSAPCVDFSMKIEI